MMSAATLVCAVVLGVPSEPIPSPPTLFPPRDFVEYYSAARVHLDGGNPYDGEQLLPIQHAIGHPHPTRPVMLWTPPFTLPLYWPFGVLPPWEAQLLWLIVQLGGVIVSSVLLWRTYAPGGSWIGFVIAGLLPILFAPMWWMLNFEQNTGYLVLGLAGFLYFHSRERPLLAGGFVALTAIKPHLLALFGVVLALDGLFGRTRRSLVTGVGVIVVLSVLAMLPDTAVFGQFRTALNQPNSESHPHPSHWLVPTLSYRLRVAVEDWQGCEPSEQFRVQFVPCVLGCVAVVPYWWKRRRTWDWLTEAPRLVLASVLLSPYGAWIFDLTVLLVPVVQAATWLAKSGRAVNIVTGVVGLSLLSVATMNRQWVEMLHDMIWFGPGVLLLYLIAGTLTTPSAIPTLSLSATSRDP